MNIEIEHEQWIKKTQYTATIIPTNNKHRQPDEIDKKLYQKQKTKTNLFSYAPHIDNNYFVQLWNRFRFLPFSSPQLHLF